MELVNRESEKTCGDDNPCIQTLDVVKDWTDQMINHIPYQKIIKLKQK